MALRDDAELIWRAGVAAVDSAAAVQRSVDCDGEQLKIGEVQRNLRDIGHIEILGAGKAGAGMAAGIEAALFPGKNSVGCSGWVNVPADCVRPLNHIHLHAARPAGLNEPTAEGVAGTAEILRRLKSLTKRDICIFLLSGGASALLCSPVSEISLADKLAVTRALASAGAPIQELNVVRTQLSRVKGGRLATACEAGLLIGLIISDVIGDPLDIIGSGPTVQTPSRADAAVQILQKYQLMDQIPTPVARYLLDQQAATAGCSSRAPEPHAEIHNLLVGSNSIALAAAREKAEQLGYRTLSLGSGNAGEAADEGRRLMQRMLQARSEFDRNDTRPLCILSGGEPTVRLAQASSVAHSNARTQPEPDQPSSPAPKGGRNQELVLAAIASHPDPRAWSGMVLLSGGTDGEDGPTDAAGAVADQSIVARMCARAIEPHSSLARHDSYPFFDTIGGLLKTGPTHTNVMDLRIALIDSPESEKITSTRQ